MKCHAKFPLWTRGQPRYSRRLGLRCTQTIKKKILGKRRQGKTMLTLCLCSGMPPMPQSVPLDPSVQFVSGSGEAGDAASSQLRGSERSRGGGAASPGGGPVRNTSSSYFPN